MDGGHDLIEDFTGGIDKIDLSAFGLEWIGRRGFSGEGGEVRYSKTWGTTAIEVDVDGDRLTDMQIDLVGRMNLSANDFMF